MVSGWEVNPSIGVEPIDRRRRDLKLGTISSWSRLSYTVVLTPGLPSHSRSHTGDRHVQDPPHQ